MGFPHSISVVDDSRSVLVRCRGARNLDESRKLVDRTGYVTVVENHERISGFRDGLRHGWFSSSGGWGREMCMVVKGEYWGVDDF